VYSNHCFTRKRDGITGPDGQTTRCYRASALKQEQELATFDEWTPAVVEQRQDMLARWAMTRWDLGADQPPTTAVDFAVTGEEDPDDDTDTDLLLEGTPEDSIG
jgi:hypothetical protein